MKMALLVRRAALEKMQNGEGERQFGADIGIYKIFFCQNESFPLSILPCVQRLAEQRISYFLGWRSRWVAMVKYSPLTHLHTFLRHCGICSLLVLFFKWNDLSTSITNVWNSRFLYLSKMFPIQNLYLWSVFAKYDTGLISTFLKPLRSSLVISPLICFCPGVSTSRFSLSSYSGDPSDYAFLTLLHLSLVWFPPPY